MKDYVGICRFSAKRSALRSKSKDYWFWIRIVCMSGASLFEDCFDSVGNNHALTHSELSFLILYLLLRLWRSNFLLVVHITILPLQGSCVYKMSLGPVPLTINTFEVICALKFCHICFIYIVLFSREANPRFDRYSYWF